MNWIWPKILLYMEFQVHHSNQDILEFLPDKYKIDKQEDSNVSGEPSLASTLLTSRPLFRKRRQLQTRRVGLLVAINVENHRTKVRLLEEVPILHRLVVKKVKGLSGEELAACNELVLAYLIGFKPYQRELDGQVPLMYEINVKVDKATSDLKNTNARPRILLIRFSSKSAKPSFLGLVEVIENILGHDSLKAS
ncbi:hypothetical protein ACH5RR_006002 [Cinchona calisaya]|uniref:Uncharacterized protein n=1 Tax=Cinchona calisaya TaxID=153742 RepID=A0ABD3AMS9_9GENT